MLKAVLVSMVWVLFNIIQSMAHDISSFIIPVVGINTS